MRQGEEGLGLVQGQALEQGMVQALKQWEQHWQGGSPQGQSRGVQLLLLLQLAHLLLLLLLLSPALLQLGLPGQQPKDPLPLLLPPLPRQALPQPRQRQQQRQQGEPPPLQPQAKADQQVLGLLELAVGVMVGVTGRGWGCGGR